MTPSSGAPPISAILGVMLLGLYIIGSVLMDEGNQMASLLFYSMVGCGVLGVIAPRFIFTLFLFQCAYLDLLKRLMVMFGNISFMDLFWVLGTAPITLAGITIGLILKLLFRSIEGDMSDWKRLVGAILANLLYGVVMFMKVGGIGKTVSEVANGSAYILLAFAVPLLFRTPEAITRLMRQVVYIFLPVALYGVYQSIFGYRQFEIDYLQTGLSIEIKQLFDGRMRPFSTLNSPTALASICALLASFCILVAPLRNERGRAIFSGIKAWLFGLIFLAGMVASTGRTDFLTIPVALVATWAFRTSGRTRIFYFFAISSFALLIVASPWVLQNLDTWNRMVNANNETGSWSALMVGIGTYSDRLMGFRDVLLNPSAYSLIGLSKNAADQLYFHDPLSELLVNHGVIGVLLVLFVSAAVIYLLHRRVLNLQDNYLRRFAAGMLALFVAMVATSLVSGSRFGVFPVNALFWTIFITNTVITMHEERMRALMPKPEKLRPERKPFATAPRTVDHRFRPTSA